MVKEIEWKNPVAGTMDIFLEEMEVLLKKYYKTDWDYEFKGEDGWVGLQMQIPSDKSEDIG